MTEGSAPNPNAPPDASPGVAPVARSSRELFGHPLGLYVLFVTEMWERFCFYGMRALLVLYVWHRLSLPDVAPHVAGYFAMKHGLEHIFGPLTDKALAYQIYGLYTAAVYLTPLFGGILADRVLGQRKTVIVGGVIMAIGEFMLMRESLFYSGLVVLTIGNGCFKSNISTQVGNLYPPGDSRRDRAFNIFYVGINMGAWISPLVCGTLGERVGWAWGFGSAGVGMVVGLVLYLAGQRYLAPDQIMQRAAKTANERAKKHPPFTRSEWAKIFALILLCALNVAFWAVYEQQGDSLQVWADESTERHVLRWLGSDWQMPSTWFQSFNPTFILLCTPFINMLWERQWKKRTEPSSVTKMAIGCFLLGISFLVMIGGARVVGAGGLASVWWLVGCSFLLTIGEIYLSPVGLSLVTKISPPRIVSMMMGMWFLSSCFGDYLSGYLATFTENGRLSGSAFFLMLAIVSLATGALMIVLYLPLKRAIGDENAPDAALPAAAAAAPAGEAPSGGA